MLVVVNDGCGCRFPATKARWWRFVDAAVQVLLLAVAASMDDDGGAVRQICVKTDGG